LAADTIEERRYLDKLEIMDLVIVESPTKAKTLSKFLGKGYRVLASLGHVRDLPKSQFGIDVEHGFTPEYIVPVKARPTVKALKEEAKKADGVWLSSDPDREGEAIAWHVAQVLGGEKPVAKKSGRKRKSGNSEAAPTNDPSPLAAKFKRAVFHEITESAVKQAFAHPRDLDLNLVNSQQARRILDRIVGYRLSPLLWKKVARNLSAGRVQSVAVRLVVERERERGAFVPKEYWSIEAVLLESENKQDKQFKAQLLEKNGKKIEVVNEALASQVVHDLKECSYTVSEVTSAEKRRFPQAPFTTSTLQQVAGNRMGFTASRTMKAAQGLYEKGLITYMRTDSVNLSDQFLKAAREYIAGSLGPSYLPPAPIKYRTKARLAQEAHEAIRPTNLELRSKNQELSGDEARVYSLIYNRALASQMNPAVYDSTSVTISAYDSSIPNTRYGLRASGSVLKFEGWLSVWGIEPGEEEQDGDGGGILPPLSKGQTLNLLNLLKDQHFTQPPARYTEATLVKALEENGIGRPSTYAPTISTIQRRGYVGREGRYLFPMDVGVVVNDLLVKHFPKIVDVDFTSKMEEGLDSIAEGKVEWVPMIREFYEPFEKLVKQKDEEIRKEDVTTVSQTKEICPECGKPLVVKLGRFGNFLSCTGFPDCKYAAPAVKNGSGLEVAETFDETQLGKCPQDEGELLVKQGRFGNFVACSNYPGCKFTKPYLQKVGSKCPQCKVGDIVYKKTSRGRTFYGCSQYPACKYASWNKPTESADGAFDLANEGTAKVK